MIVEIQGRRFLIHEREEWLQGRPFVTETPIADQSLVQTAMCHYPGAGQNWVPPKDTAAWIRFSDGLYRSDPNRGYPYGYGWQIGGNRVDWDADPIELDLWEVRGWDRRNAANNGDFCLAPETLVLTENLDYVPVGSLIEGDRIVGFDEYPVGGERRHWRTSVVLRTGRRVLPSYRVVLADGSTIVASADHRWLTVDASRRRVWQSTEQLYRRHDFAHPPKIARVLPVWQQDDSRAAGYLAGMFDGEGHAVSERGGCRLRIGVSQKANSALDEVERNLKLLGFHTTKSLHRWGVHSLRLLAPTRPGSFRGSSMVPEALRFLGTVRPHRLIDNFQARGGAESLGRMQIIDAVPIASITYIGEHEVVPLATSTGTLVAEGLAHHNSPFNTTLAPWNARTVSCQIACSQGFWDENPEVREDQILTFRYWVAWCDKIYDEHVNVLGHRQSDFTDCPGPVWPFLLQLAERPDPPPPPKPPPPDLEDEMPWRVAKKLDDSTWFMGDGTTAYTVGDAGQDISSTEAHIRMATGAVNVARQIFPESNTEGAGPKIVTNFAQVKRTMQRKYIRQYVGQHPQLERDAT